MVHGRLRVKIADADVWKCSERSNTESDPQNSDVVKKKKVKRNCGEKL